MNRRKFITAVVATVFVALVAPPRVYTLQLVAEEGGEWEAIGNTLEEAIERIVAEVEGDTCPMEDYFREIFDDALEAFQKGETEFSHWDMSCPEENFTLRLI